MEETISQALSDLSPQANQGLTVQNLVAAFGVLPHVSVIIPAWNEEKIIEPLLARFTPELRQKLGLEVIVSDGGSTDRTVALAKALADQVVEQDPNIRQTISEGRNAGAAVAKGETLIFFNADVQLPDDLEGFLRALIAGAGKTGAATCRVMVNPDEAILMDRLVLGACNAWFWFINQLGIGMGRGECHAIAKSTFQALDGYRPDLVAGEDFDLFNRIAQYARQNAKQGGNDRNKIQGITFLWNWTLYEDPRRYRNVGYARTLWAWFKNTVTITFFDKSSSKEWTPFR